MKKFISLNNLFDKLKNKGFNTFLDRLTFLRIFLIWISVVIFFGFLYYLLANSFSFLFYNPTDSRISGLPYSVYFSFVTATSIGYGDIVPFGIFKVLSILEVICGLFLLALTTSKLISIKQDIILNEIYEISFNEKINRLRSSLLVFRQNLSRIITKTEEKAIRKREINDIYIYLSSLEDILNEIVSLMDVSRNHHFKKVLDPISTELLFRSIITSFEKLNELVMLLNQDKLDWKREITINLIEKCMSLTELLFGKLNASKNIAEKTINDLNSQKKEIIEKIRNGLKTS